MFSDLVVVVAFACCRAKASADRTGRKAALKRAAPPLEIVFGPPAATESRVCDALTLDTALRRMERRYADPAKLIELRFFGGLTEDESAEFMGLSLEPGY